MKSRTNSHPYGNYNSPHNRHKFKFRKVLRIFGKVAFLCAVAFYVFWGGLLLYAWLFGPATLLPRRKPRPGVLHLDELHKVLYIYSGECGSLPYDPRGPEYALYKLKPFVEDVMVFRCPDGKRINPGPPIWDDANERVLNSDYDYINQPDIVMDIDDRRDFELIILAEKTGIRKRGKYYLRKAGSVGWYRYQKGKPKDIVGKSLDDL